MIINHFFSDVMLSILDVFEHYIFDNKPYFFQNVAGEASPHHFFQSVQFNIGNRVHQIGNYKEAAKLEFPTGIFTLVDDETAFGKMGNLLGHHRLHDVNEIVCTHNCDTDVDILLREEQAIVYFTAQINCESALYANEVLHQIKRFLPPTKYIQFAPFSSFLEIPDYFFDQIHNNPEKHRIENLFLRYDPVTGSEQYFFLAHYKPMLKLNSATAEISDNSARSFPVNCDFSYLIQLPMWMFDTLNEKRVERISLGMAIGDLDRSIIMDNNFLSVHNELFYKFAGRDFYKSMEYFINYNSPNYKKDRITIKQPKEDFLIKLTKLKRKKSTVVNWIGSFKGVKDKLKYGPIAEENRILDESNYFIDNNKLIIFCEDKPEFQPKLNEPVIVSVYNLCSRELFNKKKTAKKFFKNIYQIKDQKTWRHP